MTSSCNTYRWAITLRGRTNRHDFYIFERHYSFGKRQDTVHRSKEQKILQAMERDILLPSTPYGAAGRSLSLSACWGVPQSPGRVLTQHCRTPQNCGGCASLIKEKTGGWALNCTPFVRQCGILSNEWGVILCQKEYQTNGIHQSSSKKLWKLW